MSKGIVFVAFGLPYLLQCKYAISGIRCYDKSVDIQVITNVISAKDILRVDERTKISFLNMSSSENRSVKTNLLEYSEFDTSVYLDCDVQINGSLRQLFDNLVNYEFTIRHEPSPFSDPVKEDHPENTKKYMKKFGEFNCGVFGFRTSDNVSQLFKVWSKLNMERNTKRDQRTFLEAYAEIPELKVKPLSGYFNYTKYDRQIHHIGRDVENPVVWHYMDYAYCLPALKHTIAWGFQNRKIVKFSSIMPGGIFRGVILPLMQRYVPLFKKLWVLAARTRRRFS